MYRNFVRMLIEATKEEVRKFYPKIDQEVFDKIVDSDPTKSENKVGELSRMALDLYKKDPFATDEETIHDIYMAFGLYMKSKNVLNGSPLVKYKDVKEIDSVKTLEKVYHYIETNRRTDKINRNELLFETVFDNENWTVTIPLDYRGSIALGRDCKASWCTASSASRQMYDSYVASGDLFVFQKKNPTDHRIAYQYARRPDGRVEFKNNENNTEGRGDDTYWSIFKRENPDLQSAFDFITDQEAKIKSNPQYRAERLIERYKTSKSPYVALLVATRHPDMFDELGISKMEYTRPFQIGTAEGGSNYTTLKYEREIKKNIRGFSGEPAIFNKNGVGTLFTPSKNYRMVNFDGVMSDKTYDYLGKFDDNNLASFGVRSGTGRNSNMNYGLMNSDGEVIIEPKYYFLSGVRNGQFCIAIKSMNEKTLLKLYLDGREEPYQSSEFETIYSRLIVTQATSQQDIANVTAMYGEVHNEENIFYAPGDDELVFLIQIPEYDVCLVASGDDLGLGTSAGYTGLIRILYEYSDYDQDFLQTTGITTAAEDEDEYETFEKFLNYNQPLIEARPGSFTQLIVDYNDLFSDIQNGVDDKHIEKFVANGRVVTEKDWDDIFDRGSEFASYLPYTNGNADLYMYRTYGRLRNESYAVELIDYVIDNYKEMYRTMIQKIIDDSDGEFDGDVSNINELLDAIDRWSDDVKFAITSAIRSGEESGTMSELFKAFEKQYGEFCQGGDFSEFAVPIDNLQDLVYISYPKTYGDEVMELVGGDLDVPRDGFYGFDEEFAKERLLEELEMIL